MTFSSCGRWLKPQLIPTLRPYSLWLGLNRSTCCPHLHLREVEKDFTRVAQQIHARFCTSPDSLCPESSGVAVAHRCPARQDVLSYAFGALHRSEFFRIENRLSRDLRGGATLQKLDDLLYLYRNIVSCLPDGLVCKLAHFWHESINLQGDFLETSKPKKKKTNVIPVLPPRVGFDHCRCFLQELYILVALSNAEVINRANTLDGCTQYKG